MMMVEEALREMIRTIPIATALRALIREAGSVIIAEDVKDIESAEGVVMVDSLCIRESV